MLVTRSDGNVPVVAGDERNVGQSLDAPDQVNAREPVEPPPSTTISSERINRRGVGETGKPVGVGSGSIN